jgi:hypothetical protein
MCGCELTTAATYVGKQPHGVGVMHGVLHCEVETIIKKLECASTDSSVYPLSIATKPLPRALVPAQLSFFR